MKPVTRWQKPLMRSGTRCQNAWFTSPTTTTIQVLMSIVVVGEVFDLYSYMPVGGMLDWTLKMKQIDSSDSTEYC